MYSVWFGGISIKALLRQTFVTTRMTATTENKVEPPLTEIVPIVSKVKKLDSRPHNH